MNRSYGATGPITRPGPLPPVKDAEQAVEAEQRQRRSAPDHQRALPAQRAGNLPLAPPRNEKGLIVLAFHQDDGRVRIETVSLSRDRARRARSGRCRRLEGRERWVRT